MTTPSPGAIEGWEPPSSRSVRGSAPLQRPSTMARRPAVTTALVFAVVGGLSLVEPGLSGQAQAGGLYGSGGYGQNQPVLYHLGPGDRIKSSVFHMEGYETVAEVLSDGTINLPRLGSVPVWGLTMDQARARITTGYGRILRHPIVYIDLVEARPVRISISGEVQRPGLYSIGRGGTNQLSSGGTTTPSTFIQTSGWPTLVDALQRAGGLTAYGDLKQITVERSTGGPGSPVRTLQFDFFRVLRSGGQVTNPLLYDGDSIRVPRAENLTESEMLAVASSTFAPDTISVNVVGEVERPGAQNVKANSPLSGALLSAGGLTRRANPSTVRLLRLESSGSIKQATISFNPAATLGSPQNPPLQQGDVVVVDRHGWAKANDSLRSAMEPIAPIINAASLFRLLGIPY